MGGALGLVGQFEVADDAADSLQWRFYDDRGCRRFTLTSVRGRAVPDDNGGGELQWPV